MLLGQPEIDVGCPTCLMKKKNQIQQNVSLVLFDKNLIYADYYDRAKGQGPRDREGRLYKIKILYNKGNKKG